MKLVVRRRPRSRIVRVSMALRRRDDDVVPGLQTDVFKFFIFFIDLFLTTMCAASFSFVVGASVSSFGTGQIILVMIFVLMMVCSSDVTLNVHVFGHHFLMTDSSPQPVCLYSAPVTVIAVIASL